MNHLILPATDVRKRPQAEDTRYSRWANWLEWLAKLQLRRVLPMAFAATAAVLALWLAARFADRPIATLQVEGEFQRITVAQVEAAVKSFRGAGFVSVDLDAVRRAVQAIAWVDHARVTRRWPDGLEVSLTEHVPVARWGERGLMNTRGELFLRNAQQVPLELPQLIGPEGTQPQVARLYFEFAPQLLAVGLRLARMQLDARGAWQLTLTNRVEVRLGRQDVRSRLERLVHDAGPLLAARGSAIRYVDLRYSNGFSVSWNAPARDALGAAGREPLIRLGATQRKATTLNQRFPRSDG